MIYKWNLAEFENLELVRKISKQENLPEPIVKALLVRGIDSHDKIKKFFEPSLNDLYDPFLMHDMEKAVDRIIRALARKEKILIYGDYDVDGTTGASMLYLFLKELGANVEVYIPDRFSEGYGISKLGIERAYAKGVKTMISVDCGITAVNEVKYADSLGIDVIICDHHEPGEKIPPAYAVLDPLKENCSYPFKYLSGCGVAFKLVQALSEKLKLGREIPFQYLDYVAISSAADVVPLIDENRILVKYGLDMINSNPRASLRALFETAGLKAGRLGTWHISFIIGPRINAVGRLGDATRAVEFLISEDYGTALKWANELEEENRRRRQLDEQTLNEAISFIEANQIHLKDKIIVLKKDDWHQGVIGIVASKIVDKYYKPTILLTNADGVLKGSARSIPGFDIYTALKLVEDTLMQFGGHKHAAGMIINPEKFDEFKIAINKIAEEVFSRGDFTRELKIDAKIDFEDLVKSGHLPDFFKLVKKFEPYGPGNPELIFLVENVSFYDIKIVGNNHLKFKIKANKAVFDAIGYDLGELGRDIQNRDRISIAFTLDEGTRNGETFIQFKVKDLR